MNALHTVLALARDRLPVPGDDYGLMSAAVEALERLLIWPTTKRPKPDVFRYRLTEEGRAELERLTAPTPSAKPRPPWLRLVASGGKVV